MRELRHLGKEVNILSNKIKRRIGSATAEFGVTSTQAKIVGFIYCESKNRDIFQRDIEEEFSIRKSSVTSALNLMEKKGLIRRESSSKDGRLKKIVLTEKAIELNKSVQEEIVKVETTFEKVLNDEEFEIFMKLIKRLINEIDE